MGIIKQHLIDREGEVVVSKITPPPLDMTHHHHPHININFKIGGVKNIKRPDTLVVMYPHHGGTWDNYLTH